MKKQLFVLATGLLHFLFASSQNNFEAKIIDAQSRETIIGASAQIKGSIKGAASDIDGKLLIKDLPAGKLDLIVSFIGYQPKIIQVEIPQKEMALIALEPSAQQMDVLVVEGTRSNRTIAKIPTRVEVLTEEIEEASLMDPSKISHLLTHSTGIQVQQTSATSNTANVRIQGMDGRYAQILKDGFPIYGGFSGSLSIMQIPPLDLRQVEFIKGSASTLYGGGAISGLINLISKEPVQDETIIHLNTAQVGALDINTFVSKNYGKVGFTILGQRNTHQFFDANNDGFTNLPQLTKYNLNPRLFVKVNNRIKLTVGATFADEQRLGGDTRLMNNSFPTPQNFYSEINDVKRITTQTKLSIKQGEHGELNLRNSVNYFNRFLEITPSSNLEKYRFGGVQLSTFSEVSYSNNKNDKALITGLNFYSDNFTETQLSSPVLRNETFLTLGAFANYTFDINDFWSLESGIRGDYVIDGKFHLLPRISALLNWTNKLSTRIGGGMGYRNPTIFNQEAELLGYRNVNAIDKNNTQAEESYGFNADIAYKTIIGKHAYINLNQMFFYNYLDNPLLLTQTSAGSGVFRFENSDGFVQTFGSETFMKLGFYDFTLYTGYTYTVAEQIFLQQINTLPLTPRHSIKSDLLYEVEDKWRIGMDAEFKSIQTLTNGLQTNSFWTFGFLVQYIIDNFSVYGNVENFTNVQQMNYQTMLSGPYNTPQFTEVWGPIEGIVFNAGIRLKY